MQNLLVPELRLALSYLCSFGRRQRIQLCNYTPHCPLCQYSLHTDDSHDCLLRTHQCLQGRANNTNKARGCRVSHSRHNATIIEWRKEEQVAVLHLNNTISSKHFIILIVLRTLSETCECIARRSTQSLGGLQQHTTGLSRKIRLQGVADKSQN